MIVTETGDPRSLSLASATEKQAKTNVNNKYFFMETPIRILICRTKEIQVLL